MEVKTISGEDQMTARAPAPDYFDSAKFGRMVEAALILANDGDGMSRDELADEMKTRGFEKMDARKIADIINDRRGTTIDEAFALVDILQTPAGVEFFVYSVSPRWRQRILDAAARR